MVALALAPLAMMIFVLASNGRYTLLKAPGRKRPDAGVIVVLPFALVVRAFDFAIVDWRPALAVAGGIAILFFLLAAFVQWPRNGEEAPPAKRRLKMALSFFVLAIAYGWGVTAVTNGLLDHGTAPQLRPIVASKWRSLRDQRLSLVPQSSAFPLDEVDVDGDTYDAARIGQPICVSLHPGYLGYRWYDAAPCDR